LKFVPSCPSKVVPDVNVTGAENCHFISRSLSAAMVDGAHKEIPRIVARIVATGIGLRPGRARIVPPH
jgi:hypothetical protein